MKKIFLGLLFLPLAVTAQEKGTHFEHGLSWDEVKQKAQQEHKYLLVDCYTTWCGPCKYMANVVFPQEQVGAVMNKDFVSVKVQFDTTKKDNDEVKRWYASADAINKQYKVKAYPTFLIFSPEGELVHRMVGSSPAEAFVTGIHKAMDPQTQFYTLLKQYKAGKADQALRKRLALMAKDEVYDLELADEIASAYLERQPDPYSKENLEFLADFTESSKSKGFSRLLTERKRIDPVLGKEKVDALLSRIILKEEVSRKLKPGADIDALLAAAKAKYKTVDMREGAALLKVQYYQQTGNWNKFQPAVLAYMKQYGAAASGQVLNSFAWSVFENCDDAACVAEALAWSKRSVTETEHKEPAFLDTYANLLYKNGNKEEAIAAEEKAMALVPDNEKANYQATLDKMKKGEPTWEATKN